MEMINKDFTLEHLGCANCAMKMEKRIKALPEIASAEIVFPLKKLSIKTETQKSMASSIDKIEKIIKTIEPGVRLSEAKSAEKAIPPFSKLLKNHKNLLFSVALFAASFLVPKSSFSLFLLMAAYMLSGSPVIFYGIKNLFTGSAMDEKFLMSIATVSAWAIGEPHEAVAVMLFFSIGEIFEDHAVNDSRSAIESLLKLKPETATVCMDDMLIETKPSKVSPGSIILIKPGERIPLDGTVIEGKSFVDTSAITGESVPRSMKKGALVFSGSINKTGSLKVRVDKHYSESTISRIMALVEDAASKKASAEKFITRFAKIYTPMVVAAAFLTVVIFPLSGIFTIKESIYKAAVFLVISCPCALVISVPLSFFGGIGAASKHGILIKGGNHLENLGKIQTLLFDKTGTLTNGTFSITGINTAKGFTENDLLRYAAQAESHSSHPIAFSIQEAFGKPVIHGNIKDFQEFPGKGVHAISGDNRILAGNSQLLDSFNIPHENAREQGTLVYVAINNNYAGNIVISDVLKENVEDGLRLIRNKGIKHLAMLTGDNKDISENLADQLKLDACHSKLLPSEKVAVVEQYAKNQIIGFVGDGINDTPALATASVGISMGALGSDAAIEASDVVIMNDDIRSIAKAISISKTVRSVVVENITMALSAKAAIMLVSVFGHASMWAAVFADVGIALLAIINSIRIVRKKY